MLILYICLIYTLTNVSRDRPVIGHPGHTGHPGHIGQPGHIGHPGRFGHAGHISHSIEFCTVIVTFLAPFDVFYFIVPPTPTPVRASRWLCVFRHVR